MAHRSPDRLLHHADLNLSQIIGGQSGKIVFQQIRKGLLPDLLHALTLRADFSVHRAVHRKLGYIRQRLLVRSVIQLLHQIQAESIPVKIPGKAPCFTAS